MPLPRHEMKPEFTATERVVWSPMLVTSNDLGSIDQ